MTGHKTRALDYDPCGHFISDGTHVRTCDDAGSLREVDQGLTARYDYDGRNL